MGKKRSNLSGLSSFVAVAFKDSGDTAKGNGHGPINVLEGSRPEVQREDRPQSKKRKVGLLGAGYEKYDATGLTPHYTNARDVPDHLQKYFSQRKRYFSLYEEGCLLDEEGWYSVTPERIADQIAERCRCDTILDAFCGVGGNAIAFAKTCERVIALDTSPIRLALARHNAVIYGVADRIEFILADYLSFARTYLFQPNKSRKIDVVFLSPPWGGPSYLSASPLSDPAHKSKSDDLSEHELAETYPEYSLASIQPVHGSELFKLTRRITCNIAFFLPRNTSLDEISGLLIPTVSGGSDKAPEMVEVEEEWMGSKLKALTCYFGGLVDGQSDLF
ncbi:hypothetical protein SERLA73DRAFT_111745 [Serpula lacrymans var. lacrymans S7.3]|uniref:Trimethylguanosine synthase n=2 Tax=Serpula lacrymans var. lacrymans TaxID=341189 RepID=F8Q4A0_SERL3|nr:uncharacterized protein SERLADRAFT_362741 [Serpula lacrymans var. lacrymans S7.9]EGN96955.1 hypothetical protein SERLA73DRAFT_111745 [Serpula lacrymans var. lacrymans S7.3]EGO22550.1 hypothetical protein SERLADRAFT_362741 [Serpula lacrymans var. lacrymans S7.9]